jgi:hypothetical protein
MEIERKNGAGVPPVPGPMPVACCYDMERTSDGYTNLHVYAVADFARGQRLVLARADLRVKDLEIAKVLLKGIADAIMQQGPQILRPL